MIVLQIGETGGVPSDPKPKFEGRCRSEGVRFRSPSLVFGRFRPASGASFVFGCLRPISGAFARFRAISFSVGCFRSHIFSRISGASVLFRARSPNFGRLRSFSDDFVVRQTLSFFFGCFRPTSGVSVLLWARSPDCRCLRSFSGEFVLLRAPLSYFM